MKLLVFFRPPDQSGNRRADGDTRALPAADIAGRGRTVAEKLSDRQRDEGLQGLRGWTHDGAKSAIEQDFRFKDFSEAFAFMARVALAAEKAGHHPDWSNSYNKVTIRLSTHDVGGLSQKDIALAQAIDRIAG